jgi:hypothetical protein
MEEEKRLTEEEFVVQAIKKLRKDPYRGIHSVYSGFNEAFRKYFGTNPIEATTRLVAEGKIETRPFKGGVMLFLPGEAPKRPPTEEIIRIILGERPNLSEEEFVAEGIKKLRKDPYRGINSVFSGFNEAFRKHFNKDPIEFTSKMASDGRVEIIPLKGGKGVMLYLPGEGPRGRKTEEALKKILE